MNDVTRQTKLTCYECGGTDLVQGVQVQHIEYRGLTSTYNQPGLWCQDCGGGLLSGKEIEAGMADLRELKALAEGQNNNQPLGVIAHAP